jgi:serine/threonine-protein kinase SRPK3
MFGLTQDEIDEEHEGLISQLLDSSRCFTTHLADRLMGEFGADNLARLADFLLLVLSRSPKRPSAKQLLSTPFLADEVTITHQ